jgi:hypothetical protein
VLIEHLLCSGKNTATEVGWSFLWVIFFGLVAAGIAGYAVYKYRIQVRYEHLVKVHYRSSVDDSGLVSNSVLYCLSLQRYMDSEIRAIMAQYMPLDNQGDVPSHSHHIEM